MASTRARFTLSRYCAAVRLAFFSAADSTSSSTSPVCSIVQPVAAERAEMVSVNSVFRSMYLSFMLFPPIFGSLLPVICVIKRLHRRVAGGGGVEQERQ